MPSSSLLERTFQPLIDFVYPPACFVCEGLMAQTDSRVCASCWSTIESVGPGDPLFREMEQRLRAGTALDAVAGHDGGSGYVSGLLSLYRFEKDGTLQSIIHQLKYQGMWSLGVELGERLGERVRARRGERSIDVIVPVPLHAAKLRERGYNQSEYIARGVRKATGIPVLTALLTRHRPTASQTKLTATERLANVGDAFSLTGATRGQPRGKTILLVDDVITTGATIEACARLLMEMGARSVIAASAALADHSA